MKKSDLEKLGESLTEQDYLDCFSSDGGDDNYSLCAFDIIEKLGGSETATRRDLRKLYNQGKLDYVKKIVDGNERKYYFLKRELSDCCNAPVKLSDPAPDFIGDRPEDMIEGTCGYVCEKCGKACNLK